MDGETTEKAPVKKDKKAKKANDTKKTISKKPKSDLVGKELTAKVGQAEYKGLCVSERKTNSGAQVFLKLNGCVSRWFNIKDIVE